MLIRIVPTIGRKLSAGAVIALAALTAAPAYVGGSNMPWEAPLNQILQSIEGPLPRSSR